MSLTIYGASDDLVELEGIVSDEINGDDVVITVGWPLGEPAADRDPQGIRVRMQYAPDWQPGGVWVASVMPIDEYVPCLWPVRVHLQGYSAVVEIDCPKGTPVSWPKRKGS